MTDQKPGYNLFRRFTLRGHRWFWNYRASNGQIVFQGDTSGYSRRIDAERGIAIAMASIGAEVWENGVKIFLRSGDGPHPCGLPDAIGALGAERFVRLAEESEQ